MLSLEKLRLLNSEDVPPPEIVFPQSDKARTLTLSKSHAAFGLEVTLFQKESFTNQNYEEIKIVEEEEEVVDNEILLKSEERQVEVFAEEKKIMS